MNSNILGAVRALLLLYLIGMGISLCIAEQRLNQPAPPPPAPKVISEPSEQWTSLGTFKLTAYCPCEICCGYWATVRPKDKNGTPIIYTSSGAVAKAGTTIAVDPNVIPYGSKIKINDKIYIAQDSGSAITGKKIDIYSDNHNEALEHGVKEAEVFIKEVQK